MDSFLWNCYLKDYAGDLKSASHQPSLSFTKCTPETKHNAFLLRSFTWNDKTCLKLSTYLYNRKSRDSIEFRNFLWNSNRQSFCYINCAIFFFYLSAYKCAYVLLRVFVYQSIRKERPVHKENGQMSKRRHLLSFEVPSWTNQTHFGRHCSLSSWHQS